MTLQLVGGKRVLNVGSVVVGPHFLCWLSLGEEKHVSLYTLGIEDASRQAKDGMEIELREQTLADCLASTALEENVIWKHHGSSTSSL